MNLFALVKDPAARVQRFSLSKDVQAELATYLEAQEKAFDRFIDEIEFDGKYKPDAGEILYIDEVDDIDKLGAAIADPMSVPELVPSTRLFDSVCALFSGRVEADKSATVLLQNFDRRRVISTNGLTIFQSKDTFNRVEGLGLTIDYKLAAILRGKRLRFASFHNARQIFDLTAYYVEATDADISSFAQLQLLKADQAKLVANSDTWVRRKIALVQQSQILAKVSAVDIQTAAAAFGLALEVKSDGGSEKLVIPVEKAELKNLLRFLDEDVYEAVLTKKHYMSNSKRLAKLQKKPPQ